MFSPQVVVIDKGCVAEQGTHDHLIAKKGIYKKLVLRQLMTAESKDKDGEHPEDQNNDAGDIMDGVDNTRVARTGNVINEVEEDDVPAARFTVGTAEE